MPLVPVHHVLTYWDNRVHLTPNTVTQGTTLTGLAGRVWLFNDTTRQTVDANGTMVVELYDMTQVAPGGQPIKLADWTFDAATLKQLKRNRHGR